MLVRLQIPKNVYDKVMSGEDIYAITRWNDSEKAIAYKIISELSGFDNFWFSMLVDGVDENELAYHCCRSNSNTDDISIIADIPESETFVTDFYEFSDLIFFTGIEPDQDKANEIIKLFKSGKCYQDLRQVIFPVLRKSYIKNTI